MSSEMDEAEKYKQRLEAIAERKQQQEEDDRRRREMEDEKIRLHQLKRKSLRDQWLMEVVPSPPTTPEAWTPQTMYKDRSSDTQQLEEKIGEPREQGEMDISAHNRRDTALATAALHIGKENGTGHFCEDSTVVVTKEVESLGIINPSPGLDIGVTVDRHSDSPTYSSAPSIDSDGGEMMVRAECVITTVEDDDTSDEIDIQRSEESLVFEFEAAPSVAKPVVGLVPEERLPEELPRVQHEGHSDDCAEEAIEGAQLTTVPVSFELCPSNVSSEQEPEHHRELKVMTSEDSCQPGQFQEVPLNKNQCNHRPLSEEQEPMLSPTKEHRTVEVEPDNISTEIHGETRLNKVETKSCKCCSVM